MKELSVIYNKPRSLENISTNYSLTEKVGKLTGPATITLSSDRIEPFTITFSNDKEEKVVVGFDLASNKYFIDRSNSGNVSFEKGFARKHIAPRIATKENVDVTLIIDNASIELFADNGLSVMTEIFFPTHTLHSMRFNTSPHIELNRYSKYKQDVEKNPSEIMVITG